MNFIRTIRGGSGNKSTTHKRHHGRPTISEPKDFRHQVHTGYDARERRFYGLPPQWEMLIQSEARPKPLIDPSKITDPTDSVTTTNSRRDYTGGQRKVDSSNASLSVSRSNSLRDDSTKLRKSKLNQYESSGTTISRDNPQAASLRYDQRRGQTTSSSTLTTSNNRSDSSQPRGILKKPRSSHKTSNGIAATLDNYKKTDDIVSHEQFKNAIRTITSKDDPTTRFDRFVKIAEGSTSIVSIAHDYKYDRKVAIKKMDLTRQQRRELLFNEVRTVR